MKRKNLIVYSDDSQANKLLNALSEAQEGTTEYIELLTQCHEVADDNAIHQALVDGALKSLNLERFKALKREEAENEERQRKAFGLPIKRKFFKPEPWRLYAVVSMTAKPRPQLNTNTGKMDKGCVVDVEIADFGKVIENKASKEKLAVTKAKVFWSPAYFDTLEYMVGKALDERYLDFCYPDNFNVGVACAKAMESFIGKDGATPEVFCWCREDNEFLQLGFIEWFLKARDTAMAEKEETESVGWDDLNVFEAK